MPDSVRQRTGLPRIFTPVVECPAGEPIAETPKGSGVRCRLTHSNVLSMDDPTSLRNFCCSAGYRGCPVWLAEKARIAEGRREALVA